MERDSIILLWFSGSISTEVEAFKIFFTLFMFLPSTHINQMAPISLWKCFLLIGWALALILGSQAQ